MKRRVVTRSRSALSLQSNLDEENQNIINTDNYDENNEDKPQVKKLRTQTVGNKQLNKFTKTKIATIYSNYEHACLFNRIHRKQPSMISSIMTSSNNQSNTFKQNDNYYVGTYSVKLIKKLADKFEIKNDLHICNELSSYFVDFSDFKPNIINDDLSDDQNTDLIYEIKLDYLFWHTHELHKNKCLFYVYNRLDIDTNSVLVDIYFTSKLKFDSLADNPSEIIYFKLTRDVNILMNYFYDVQINCLENVPDNNNENEDDNDDDTRSEILFDLIYYEHKKQIENDYNNVEIDFQTHSYLLSILRPYQINAIKWMLKREGCKRYFNVNSDDSNQGLHTLFCKILNKFEQNIYYQKHIGVFTDKIPLYVPSLPGGILADDMGLGKTLEVLGCILLNPRVEFPDFEIQIDKDKILVNQGTQNFSCVCGNVPKDMSENQQEAHRCRSCGVWTHKKCVNFSGDKHEFLCPRCCTLQKPIPSGCTLIVTPSVISHQWIDEIKKHLQDKSLKVLLYKGCAYHGFLQPRDLADLDICITTYDVLTNELNHVWSMEKLPNLRHVKRFMSLPSPLICVEWWRICLDEAQMVHSTNTKCAEMASRLFAVNRWCVTGTPIGRSLSDLHGLFTFIREDPYYEKRWFDQLLYTPYRNGNKKPMVDALSKVLWRTTKRFVIDQIDIPNQVEKIHWLSFTPFEKHLYERILEMFRESRSEHIKNLENLDENLNLDLLDRETLNRVLLPLLDLRFTCDHPQLILRKRAFLSHHSFKKEKILTMEKSLQILTKKTKTECEEKYRLLVLSMNGLAGLSIIENKYDEAIKYYKDILKSEKDYENKITIDKLQKIHTLHNLNEVLVLYKNEPEDEDLKGQLTECEQSYMVSFNNTKIVSQEKMYKKVEHINELLNKHNDEFQSWWIILLNSIEESKRTREFLDRLSMEISLNIVYNNNLNDNMPLDYTICNKSFRSIDGLKKICADELAKFDSSRESLLENLEKFSNDIDRELVAQATDCHLRPTEPNHKNKNKCELCKCDHEFHLYSKKLFSHSDEVLKYTENDMKNEDDDNDLEIPETRLIDAQNIAENLDREKANAAERKFFRSASDLEKLFKILCSFCKNDEKLHEYVKVGKKVLELYELFKEEFKVCRQFWISASHQIQSYDEVEMGKMRLRLKEPNDRSKENYLIEPYSLQTHIIKSIGDKNCAELDLRKKLGQLLYLQNLSKSYSLENDEVNEDVCPICQHALGTEWYLLVCGHCFCKECITSLINSEHQTNCACFNCRQRVALNALNKNVRCPLCREVSKGSETYLVHANKSTTKSANLPITSNASCNNTNEDKTDQPCTSEMAMNNGPIQIKNGANAIEEKMETDEIVDEFEDIKIKGKSNSTKVEGVIKCLIKILKEDPNAKCLVFSIWLTMLDLIQDSLKENYIEFRYLKESNVQKNLLEFKHNENINVLLIPYNFGANGLNLIEATHILLVEPILNVSQEVQAIGRIHRIGQTKTTFIHRFLVHDTIEQFIYKLLVGNTNYQRHTHSSDTDRKPIKIADLQNLFLSL